MSSDGGAFPRIDVAADASEHSYLTKHRNPTNCPPNISTDAHKQSMREWRSWRSTCQTRFGFRSTRTGSIS
ncbi:unnamed protein product [Linum trigynum]|uniref:Uncharacterized protein n=1 Tax=Linum trigynum TaxID=586398 RepID=A0AAV2E3L6_9ROSI